MDDRFVKYKKCGVSLLDRDNVALLTLLRFKNPTDGRRRREVAPVASNPRFQCLAACASSDAVTLHDDEKRAGLVCVANTHLLFNPKRGDIKLAQVGVV